MPLINQAHRARARIMGSGVITRILLLAMPPLATLLVLSGILMHQQLSRAKGYDRIAQLSSVTAEVGALVHELQRERGASGVVLGSKGLSFRTELALQRRSTDEQLTPLLMRVNAIVRKPSAELTRKVLAAQADLNRLAAIREKIDTLEIPPQDSFDYFTETIARLLEMVLESGAATQDPAASRTFVALFDLMHAKERAGQERATGAQGFAAGVFSPALLQRFSRLREEQNSFLKIFGSYATESQRAILQQRLAEPVNDEIEQMRQVAFSGGLKGQVGQIDGARWFNAATRRINLLREVEVALAGELLAAAKADSQAAREAFLFALAGLVAVIATITGISLAMAHGLARPIRRMTQIMSALAAGDNTVSVPNQGQNNEIGQMAAAVEVFRINAIVRQEREAQIAHMAQHDALTNLANRKLLHDRLEFAMTLVGRGGSATVLCIDLDGFKATNDTYGHLAGDHLLRITAERMQACVRETDTVARLGGDEFVIVQVGLIRADDAHTLAARLLKTVAQPVEVAGHQLTPRMSIGIAVAPVDGGNGEILMRNADIALYRAKADGGHTYRFFEPAMEARLLAKRQLEADLRVAMTTHSFELFYQPLVDGNTSVITGFEALIRWMHPTRGRVSPADFIPIAEETGLIVPLGEWILNSACDEAARWDRPLTVAVNLSSVQFKDRGLVAKVETALARSGLNPSRLELEITESVLLLDDEQNMKALHGLRQMGVRIALDDFGTGYSSLSYLRSFPFDKIKIDQSFIRDLGVTKDAQAIIRAVIMLGHSLGITITAEGVETVAQLALLRAEGCNQLQGYLFSPPSSSAYIQGLIERLQGSGAAMSGPVQDRDRVFMPSHNHSAAQLCPNSEGLASQPARLTREGKMSSAA